MLAMILALPALCLGQDTTSGGPDSIIAGPFGEPRMVMSEGGEWSLPIKVFADSEVETFVPDISSPGWVSWHVEDFRQNGTYFTYLYIYHLKSRMTGRETIYVNTRQHTVVVVRPLLAPIHVDLSKASPELSKSIARITAIVKDDAENFHGTTIQQAISQDKIITLRNILCSNNNPDCDLSDADLKKKYPIYPTSSPQMIPGAIPGVNCGIGTNRSCCCANDATASDSPDLHSTAQPSPSEMENGIYRIGNGISAPVLLYAPDAEFSDEARRAKYQGDCIVQTIVDAQGIPQGPRVIRSLGHGLDEKALEAVRKYKFKPAMKGNTPVPVMITVEVKFRLYTQ
jgi:TonB family protein